MTFDAGPGANNGTGAILRALASLMSALGEDASPAGLRAAAPAPVRPSPGTRPTTSDVNAILDDARQRAERVIEESMQRARELVARAQGPSADGDPGSDGIESLRSSVHDLLAGMRDVQARLGRIESLLGTVRAPGGVSPAPPPPARPAGTPRPAPEPAEGDRRPGSLSVVTPQDPIPPSPPPPPVAPAAYAPAAPAPGAPPAGDDPASARARAYFGEEVTPRPAEQPAAPSPWERPAAEGGEDDTLATFTPADGAVLVRAAPVSGFQGLMRLQDALQRIPAVRQATVEAYSQGEARLRIEIASAVDSDEIAEYVGAGLGEDAQVRGASEAERTIVIALG